MTTLSKQRSDVFRTGVVMAILTLVVPVGCHALFVQQEHTLQTLADDGVQVDAVIERVTMSGSIVVNYAYGDAAYTQSVRASAHCA